MGQPFYVSRVGFDVYQNKSIDLIRDRNFYIIELVPGSCHIFVVVADACVVDLSMTWLFNLKLDGQQKTI